MAVDIIRNIRVRQIIEGGEALRRDLQAAQAAIVATQTAAGALANTVDQVSNRTLSAGPKFRALGMQLDGTAKSYSNFEKGVRNANIAFAQGITDQTGYEQRIARLSTVLDETTKKTAGLTAAQRAQAQGAIEAAAAAERVAAANQSAINNMLGVGGSGSGSDRAADFAAAADGADKLRMKYDPLFRAEVQHKAALDEINDLNRQGVLVGNAFTAALERQNATFRETQEGISGVAAARQADTRAGVEQARAAIQAQQAQAQAGAAYQTALNARLGVSGSSVRDGGADFAAAADAADRLRAKYDPLFRAQQQYRAGLAEIRDLNASGVLTGDAYTAAIDRQKASFAQAINELGRYSAAQERTIALSKAAANAAEGWKNLGAPNAAIDRMQANGDAGRAMGSLSYSGGVQNTQQEAAAATAAAAAAKQAGLDRAAGMEAAEKAAQRELAALLPLEKAQQEYDATVAAASRNRVQGNVNAEQYNQIIDGAKVRLLNQTNEANKASEAQAKLAKSAGLTAYGYQNLSYQVNDVATSLASGIPPFQVLAQQGGQIYQILEGGQGGVRGALKGIASDAGAFAGRIGIAGAAVGVIGASFLTAGVAAISFMNTQDRLKQQLAGIGAASGNTVGSLNDLASAASASGQITTRTARDVAGALAATGKIGPDAVGPLIKIFNDYSKTTGQDAAEASKTLAEAMADLSGGGLATLQKQTAAFNDTQMETIKRLDASGQRLAAQRMATDLLAKSLTDAKELTSGWGKLTESVIKSVSEAWDGLGQRVDKVVTGGSLEDRIASARGALKEAQELQSSVMGRAMGGLFGQDVGSAQKALDDLLAKQKKAADEADRRAKNLSSTQLGDLVRSYNPMSEQLKKLQDDAENIRKKLADGVLDPDGKSRRTMEGILAQAAQLKTDLAAGGAAFADSLRNAQFGNRTVGFTGEGLSAAQINKQQDDRLLLAQRDQAANADLDTYANQVATIEKERAILLDTLKKATTLDLNATGGAFSRMAGNVQMQILSAATASGKISAAIIAGIADKESSGNPNIGFTKVLNKDGTPSTTAYGLGQITAGTAREAIKGGYLPADYDRTDPNRGAEGIAGVLKMKLDQAGGDMTKAIQNYYGSKDPAANAAYAADVMRRAGQMGDPSTAGVTKELDSTSRAARDAELNLANVNANYGKNGLALEAAAQATAKYNQLLDAGVPPSEALQKAIQGFISTATSAAQQAKLTQFGRDSAFDREQLGRSDAEQNAYARARSMVGDTSTGAAQFIIQQQTINDNLKQSKDLAKDAFGGIATDISHGISAMDALSSAFTRFADKLISMAADKAISGMFGGLMGGSGGGSDLLGSLFKSFGGGSAIPSFANGGIMTSRGQIPLNAYANGGVANSPQLALFGEGRGPEAYVPLPDGKRIPVNMNAPANTNGGGNVTVINNGEPATASVERKPNGDMTVILDAVDKGLAKKSASGRSSFGRSLGGALRG